MQPNTNIDTGDTVLNFEIPKEEAIQKAMNSYINDFTGKILPVGKRIRIDEKEGVVTYINSGRGFTTAKLDSGNLPELNKKFMFEGTEYVVTNVNEKKKRFSFSAV